jgi:hypothetical protein
MIGGVKSRLGKIEKSYIRQDNGNDLTSSSGSGKSERQNLYRGNQVAADSQVRLILPVFSTWILIIDLTIHQQSFTVDVTANKT